MRLKCKNIYILTCLILKDVIWNLNFYYKFNWKQLLKKNVLQGLATWPGQTKSSPKRRCTNKPMQGLTEDLRHKPTLTTCTWRTPYALVRPRHSNAPHEQGWRARRPAWPCVRAMVEHPVQQPEHSFFICGQILIWAFMAISPPPNLFYTSLSVLWWNFKSNN